MKLTKGGITLSKLTENDIELVRNWRNDPKVSQYMIVRTHITKEMQDRWFKTINNHRNYYFIIENDGEKIGLANIKEIDYETKCGEFGIFLYYENYLNSGLAVKVALMLLDFGFYELKLETICAHILKTNKRAIRFNKGLGFSIIENQKDADNQLYELIKESYELSRGRLLRIFR